MLTSHNQWVTLNRYKLYLLEHHIAVDLITGTKLGLSTYRCLGLYVLNLKTGKVSAIRARFVILATGGAGKAYLYTSNPDVATGDIPQESKL
jgi:L-aspartate oxidase